MIESPKVVVTWQSARRTYDASDAKADVRLLPRFYHTSAEHPQNTRENVPIDGTDYSFGEFGTPDSHDRYEAIFSDWLKGREVDLFTLTVDELALRYAVPLRDILPQPIWQSDRSVLTTSVSHY